MSRNPDPAGWTDAYLLRVANRFARETRRGVPSPTLQAARGHPQRVVYVRTRTGERAPRAYAAEHPRNREVVIGAGLLGRTYRRVSDVVRFLRSLPDWPDTDWYVSAHGVPTPEYGGEPVPIRRRRGERQPRPARVWRVVAGSFEAAVEQDYTSDEIDGPLLRELAQRVFEPGSIDSWEVVWRDPAGGTWG